MGNRDMNKLIIAEIRSRIQKRGLAGKLDVFPVENAFTRRPRYWNDGRINLFKVFMWDLNKLESDELSKEIDSRISAACKHFNL